MDITGEVRIPASREAVWAALNNPEILHACIPGCEELEMHSDTEMTAVALVKVGPIAARFDGAVTLSELDPPNGYRLTGEGQSPAGFARMNAIVRLAAEGEETILSYTVDAQVGGKLAQLGGRMIDATAKTLSAAFFKELANQLAPVPETAAAGQPAPAATTAPGTTAPRRVVRAPARPAGAGGGRGIAWAALGIACVALVLAWRAFVESTAEAGAGLLGGTSADFNSAVLLLVVLAIGYLLGRQRASN